MASSPQKDGLQFERRLAKLLGAKLQPGSGNQWYAKLDLDTWSILFSLKHTGKDSLKVTRSILREAIQRATEIGSKGAIPAVATDIAGEDFVLLRADDFALLMQEDVKLVSPPKAAIKRLRASTPEILRDND